MLEFYHVHPDQLDKHTYEVNLPLIGESYKVFIDIDPKGKQYFIEPNKLEIHHSQNSYFVNNANMKVDTERIKEIKGTTVELSHDPFEVGKDITLTFDFKGVTPDPYLGALGHVVIIDDELEKFIHVHPISDHETVFVAHFEEKGMYKLWGEFKFKEEVIAFSWVIEVM